MKWSVLGSSLLVIVGCIALTSCGGPVSKSSAEKATKEAQSKDPAYNPDLKPGQGGNIPQKK